MAGNTGVVDVHTHIIAPWAVAHREELARTDPCFGALYSNPKATLATAEDLIRSMDEAEVDVSVALNIGWNDHNLCIRSNDYLLESSSRWPDRIIPFCMVQPTAGDLAVRELERCASAGARGIGELRPDVQGFALTDAGLLSPLVDAAIDRDMCLLIHSSEPVGHPYPGKGTLTPEHLYAFARSFPSATIVCAHWGGGLPFYTLMPEVEESLSNVHYDTAATQYLYRAAIFEVIARINGHRHMLFGSDFPLLTQRRALQHARSAGLDDVAAKALLGGNARRLLHMETPDD